MGTKVFIYSVPRDTATRVHDFVNDSSGKRMKKTKIGKTRDTIQALYSPKYSGLANGLSYKPWVDPETGKQKVDSDGRPLTLQDKEEQKWNLPKGYLTNRSWQKGDSMRAADMPYFQKASWKLNDGATVLDLDNFDDNMFYHVALDSKLIANSEAELRAGKWPKATHYIALENEEETLKYTRNQLKSKAFAALHDKQMTTQTKKDFCYLLDLANSRVELQEDVAHNLLFSYIDKSTFTPGSNIEKFNALISLLSNANGRKEFEARLLLKKAMDARVVYEKQDSYKWNRSTGLIVLGETKDEAIEFLLNPKKEVLIEELEAEIKAKLA